MGKYEADTRKAIIDLEAFLEKKKIPPVYVIVRTFMKRYGFKRSTVMNMLKEYPEYEYDKDTDMIRRKK